MRRRAAHSPLDRLDLNLLVALDVLLAERNVTRAAHRVGLSQPAMSNALARLRKTLGDPLLVRARGEMVPTPVGLEIGRAMSAALGEIERALEQRGAFDPARSERAFTIAASDYVCLVLLEPFVVELQRTAPGITIRIVALQPDVSLGQLESRAIDLTVGYFRRAPSSLRRAALFSDRFVLAARAGHPITRRKLRVRDLPSYAYVQIAPHGELRGLLDAELARHGLTRRVALTVPWFTGALVVARSDLVTVVPERLARELGSLVELSIAPLPATLPRIAIAAHWHERVHRDPAHAWLRAALATRASRIASGSSATPRSTNSARPRK